MTGGGESKIEEPPVQMLRDSVGYSREREEKGVPGVE